MFSLTVLLLIGYFCGLLSTQCIMDGPCIKDSFGDVSCAKRFEPRPLQNRSSAEFLKRLCPFLGLESRLCCNDEQVFRFRENFKLPGSLLSRCPPCMENFKRIFCSFACSPIQSSFLNITKVERNNNSQDLVKEITYFIEDDQATRLYESCKNVRASGLGSSVMDVMCGPGGEKTCSGRNWLKFMGSDSSQGGFNPFQMNFRFLEPSETIVEGDSTFRALKEKMSRCDTPDGVDRIPCSCADCERSCSANSKELPPLFEHGENWKIFGYNAMVFLVVFITCLVVGVVLIVLIVQAFCRLGYPPPRSIIRRAGNRCLQCLTGVLQVFVCLEVFGFYIENKLKSGFRMWGVFVAHHPFWIMGGSFVTSLAMSLGLWYFSVTTDPVDLWVSVDSRARQDMDYFNENFQPFYRTQQLILVPKNQIPLVSNITNVDGGNFWGPAFRQDFLLEAEKLQKQVEKLIAKRENGVVVKLEDICLSPLLPLHQGCLIQSIFAYYRNSPLNDSQYLKQFKSCVGDLANDKCYGAYGGPLVPVEVTLGDMEKDANGTKLYTAKSLVITIPVINYLDKKLNQPALEWEKEFLKFLKGYKHKLMTVAYRAERSIEDELRRGSEADTLIVALSYVVMFVYISLALGDIRSCAFLMTDTKIMLGIAGVLIVFVSMTASLGIFCYCHIPASLIVIQVLPFLILAVGVDNVFLLVHTFQSDIPQPDEKLDVQIGRVVGDIAPSMLLSSLSMCACFFIGAISPMPVIRVFALYAGVAIVINFFLQMTAFLAAFTLDAQRQHENRWDLCWCVVSSRIAVIPGVKRPTSLTRFFKNVYAPFLMKRWVRIVVLVIFLANLLVAVSFIYHIEIGFEQEDAMPRDSYLQMYFKNLTKYLSVGPPVYFVITEGFNYSDDESFRRVCGGGGCHNDSLVSTLAQMSRFSNRSYIAVPPTSWIDDYIAFMRSEGCCHVVKNSATFCPSSLPDVTAKCDPCISPPIIPKGDDFYKYVSFFLDDTPSKACPSGGRALHRQAVRLKLNSSKEVIDIGPTYLMSYHTSLRKSQDYILALEYSRYFAGLLQKRLRGTGNNSTKAEVRPYSLPHVFYEQYLTIWKDTLRGLSFSLIAIFVVVFIFMGLDFFSAIIITLTIIMILISVMGMMQWWKIPLNAVSLVNLVVAVGISVEFCSHLTLAFSLSNRLTRVDRAQEAIGKLGRSIIAGITLTDSGVLILAFAKSTIFQVYYFRMYLGIILFGTVHSIVFLPVLLSWVGPPVKNRTKRQSESLNLVKKSEVTAVDQPETEGLKKMVDEQTNREKDDKKSQHETEGSESKRQKTIVNKKQRTA